MDLELIRDVLFYIEECKTGLCSNYDSHFIEKLKNNNYTIEFNDAGEYFGYQMRLIQCAEFIINKKDFVTTQYDHSCIHYSYRPIEGLSNQGHDYINSIREKKVWDVIKQQTKNSLSLDRTIELAKKISKGYIWDKLGLN